MTMSAKNGFERSFPMERTMIQYTANDAANAHDPVLERSLFFSELEMIELVMTIPQATPVEAKAIY
jgi:hypothetical protein